MIIIETCPECGNDLVDEVITTYPPIPRKACFHCGWSWEGKREEIVRVPFKEDAYTDIKDQFAEFINIRNCPMQPSDANFESSPCANCPTNPKNGGDGICFCILGQPQITC